MTGAAGETLLHLKTYRLETQLSVQVLQQPVMSGNSLIAHLTQQEDKSTKHNHSPLQTQPIMNQRLSVMCVLQEFLQVVFQTDSILC